MLGAASFATLPPRAAAEEDSLDEALALVSRRGPEFGGGLCQIGTTMFRVTMNAGLPILERQNHSYRVRYYEPPVGMDVTIYEPKPDFRFRNDYSERQRLSEADLRSAFGDPGRVGDLTAFFARRIDEEGAKETIRHFVPRLLPGLCAAGFHGLIRTAHAARSLARSETAIRRSELAEGLGYWAARYRELPAPAAASGNRFPAAGALLRVRPIPPERRPRGSIAAAFAALDADRRSRPSCSFSTSATRGALSRK